MNDSWSTRPRRRWLLPREPKDTRYIVTSIVSLLIAVTLDQGTKWYAQQLPEVVITLNPGISFGFLQHMAMTYVLFVVLFFVAIVMWVQTKLSPIITGLFVGAALSNIIDRIVFGGVRDFLPVPLTNITNNVADWIIVGLMLYWIVFESRQKEQQL